MWPYSIYRHANHASVLERGTHTHMTEVLGGQLDAFCFFFVPALLGFCPSFCSNFLPPHDVFICHVSLLLGAIKILNFEARHIISFPGLYEQLRIFEFMQVRCVCLYSSFSYLLSKVGQNSRFLAGQLINEKKLIIPCGG